MARLEASPQVFSVSTAGDVTAATRAAMEMATAIGFGAQASEEIALATGELAANLIMHARRGTVALTPLKADERIGIQIESEDGGPGITDVDQAMADGFSTKGSLGGGLGAVNRMMDEFDIRSKPGEGTLIVCKRWLHPAKRDITPCPLSFGAATRACPTGGLNGDAFVIKNGSESAFVAVIDGLGHGQYAHRAAQAARWYVETHFDQPLVQLFRGVGRNCLATRGVVMAVARIDWSRSRLTFASVGNIEARMIGAPVPLNLLARRGILGANAPDPLVTEHRWEPGFLLVLHSDGVSARWRSEDLPYLAGRSATDLAQDILGKYAGNDDDATVVVVMEAGSQER